MAASATNMKTKKTFGQWFKSRKVQQWLVIVSFMIVPVLLLLVFSYVPFAKMFEFSLYKMKSYDSKNNTYVGFKNYIDVFTRDDCFNSLKLAGYYIVASFIQLAMALYFATILCFKVRGSSLFKGLIFFPYLISGIAIGFIFKFFYTRGFVLDTVLSCIGLNPENLPYWLKDTRINNASLAATSVWRYMGQNMVLFLGAMMSVDPCLYEAASIDGANAWPKFRYIMLPSIKSVIVLNMILSISGSLSAFEPPYVITGGTFGTATYFVMMNSLAHEKGKIGLAAAMAVVLMGLIFIVTIFQQVIMKLIDEDAREERRNRKIQKQIIHAGAGDGGTGQLWDLHALGLFVLLHRFDSLSQMQVTVLDVGQGDGIFLKSPGGMTCMIDGGSSDVKNVGQYRIEPYLLSKGVGTLDYVFISHGDSDHTNGIEEMISRQKIGVKMKTLVFPKESVWDESLKKLAIYAIENGVQVAVMEQGQEIEKQGMKILCLCPGSDYSGGTGNGASMVLSVSYREFDFLFTGDVEGIGEEKLCESIEKYCPEKAFEILKAAHHGSRNSSSETFLQKVRPKYTIISAGIENSYGHPHRETIERLEKTGSRILATANCGGIEITVEFGGKIQYTLKEGSETTAYEESE